MITDILHLMKHELLLCGILFITLLLKIRETDASKTNWPVVINLLLALNVIAGFLLNKSGDMFNGLFRNDELIILQKNILQLGLLVVSLMAYPWIRGHRHLPEFYMLIIATLLGMSFMLSSGHFLLFYIGLELATIPLAALSNFHLNKASSSEAGVKMILSGAFSSALLLMGISLLYGTTGTLSFDELSLLLEDTPLQIFAFILIFTGFAFKLSVVPFHFWTADVYEGAPVPVAAYLSVVSKAAVAFVFTTALYAVFYGMFGTWYTMIFLLAVLTIGIGNLFALRQQNIKRFLAFSSIAQIGFILIGLSGASQAGQSSVIYFLLIYLFSNLGAFSVVTVISAGSGREHIDDLKGFYKTNPLLSWVLTISLFSLAGVPPTAGFFGKLFLLTAGAGAGNYLLIGFAALNMVVSMYYYLRIVKAIFMDENPQPIPALTTGWIPGLALLICMAGVLSCGFAGSLHSYIYSLSSGI